jgi:hypothetical protein
LNKKGANYDKLDEPLDRPLITAITSWGSIDEPELSEALFGHRNGYSRRGSDPRGTRMSAVLFANAMRTRSGADRLPKLWLNPWAANPLTQTEPFATVSSDEGGNLVRTPASMTAAELFGVGPDWTNND